jgi:hypothetical protein
MEFDGSSWTVTGVATHFTQLRMVPDPSRDRVLGFDFHHSWEYATPFPARVTAFGAGCPASAGVLQSTATSRPWLGDTVTGRLAPVPAGAVGITIFGWSATAWGGLPLPFSLAPLGAPACELLAEPLLLLTAAGTGNASWSLALPNVPAAAGQLLFTQGAVLEAGANALGLATSNALELRLGIR